MITGENKYDTIDSLSELLAAEKKAVDCCGICGDDLAYLVSRIYTKFKKTAVIIERSQKEAEKFINGLEFFSGNIAVPVLYIPPHNISRLKELSSKNNPEPKRIKALYELAVDSSPRIVVTTIQAVLQKIIPKKNLCDYADIVIENEDIEQSAFIEKLITGGYKRTLLVEEPGEFAVRGGIVDVFSPVYDMPVRIELFGDTVDSIRFFDPVSQRKVKNLKEAVLIPAKETVLNKKEINEIINKVRIRASYLGLSPEITQSIVKDIKEDSILPENERLVSLIYENPAAIFDYINENAFFIIREPAELKNKADNYLERVYKDFETNKKENKFCIDPETFHIKWNEADNKLYEKNRISIKSLEIKSGLEENKQETVEIRFQIKDNLQTAEELKNSPRSEAPFKPLSEWIAAQKEKNNLIIIICRTKLQGDRLKFLLEPYGISLKYSTSFDEAEKHSVNLCIGDVKSGFAWDSELLSVITEDEIFGEKHVRRKKAMHSPSAEKLTLSELQADDLVVHAEHGIGLYKGLVKLKLEGIVNDFLLIYYKDDDKLYLPVERMSMIQKYIGVDSVSPVLDKMGGKSWEQVKQKVKQSVKKIAGELLKLYAERKIEEGHSFIGDDAYFRNFEAGFAYEETPDQLKAIEDVLADMEKTEPMDRLVCGDVGYGKTEVAMRAAFKAAQDNKQTAVLVPTTILAQQHLETFKERFQRYPIVIECLSRFKSRKEQSAIIKDLSAGKVDIIIGTHRLLQKDISFKDIGLLILDEEHRFGVRHKERIKTLRKNVDVLTLTATPIPRTLHLSLTGFRDISVISTPPEMRQPITTYLCEFEDGIVVEAIEKELARKGQIFFIHNNTHTIWNMAHKLQKLVPRARIDVAHGRMNEKELEKAMLRFINKEIDMLVCTTIVESGLDIPAANTILVNRADRFGLAQMHQLRGRVGRAQEEAFAYLFIPKETALSEQAQKRLKVLMEHSDLGSGFQIAMNDLKIRGGGSVLGASQSGHIAAVGYDMFLQLMENAVNELKGEKTAVKLEPEINMSMSAFIPETYIPDIDQRLSAYRRLAKMTEIKEISMFKEELEDRFGALCTEAGNLLLKIMLRVLSIQAGIKRLDIIGRDLFLHLSAEHIKKPEGIIELVQIEKNRYKMTSENVIKVRLSETKTQGGLLAQTKNILKEIMRRVNG